MQFIRFPRRQGRARLALLVALAASLSTGFLPATAGPLDGWASSNVEFVRNIRVGFGPAPTSETWGTTLFEGYLYVTGTGILTIYDVSEPEEPKVVGRLAGGLLGQPDAPNSIAQPREDPETNGSILPTLVGQGISEPDLLVLDVSDKARPRVLSQLSLAGGYSHNISCIARCRWAYTSDGRTIDLRDPARPELMKRQWDAGLEFKDLPAGQVGRGSHDVTQVAKDLVVTASIPMYLLNVRNPLRPRVLARSDSSPYSYGGVSWPNGGTDHFLISFGGPGFVPAPGCKARDGARASSYDSAFATWDARHWKTTGLLLRIDQYFPSDGTFVDGNPPASATYESGCAANWFDPHPRFRNGGLLVASAMGNGFKFLDVSAKGAISEVGYWLPSTTVAFGSIDAQWVTEEIVYAIGLERGIDILRFRGDVQ